MPDAPTPEENIYNTEVFNILVEYEISRSRRYPSPVTLLEIEVSPAPPETLSKPAMFSIFLKTLTKNLRSADIPSQTGDNRFKALLPTTDENGARAVCERLLSVFNGKFQTPDGKPVTFSLQIGAAAHPGGASLSSAGLFAQAEEALKQAKAKGARAYLVLTNETP